MSLSLLDVFYQIRDRRRKEGRRFPLAPVLLYCVIAMIAGANSYRQMHGFIAAHLDFLNAAFGQNLRSAPSYCGLRLILCGLDPKALEAAFRRHAQSLCTPQGGAPLRAIAVDGKTLRGSFDALADVKAMHMLSALDMREKIILAHVAIDEKSNEIPAAQAFIKALGLTDCLFTLDAEHCQKNIFERKNLEQSSAHAGERQSAQAAATA